MDSNPNGSLTSGPPSNPPGADSGGTGNELILHEPSSSDQAPRFMPVNLDLRYSNSATSSIKVGHIPPTLAGITLNTRQALGLMRQSTLKPKQNDSKNLEGTKRLTSFSFQNKLSSQILSGNQLPVLEPKNSSLVTFQKNSSVSIQNSGQFGQPPEEPSQSQNEYLKPKKLNSIKQIANLNNQDFSILRPNKLRLIQQFSQNLTSLKNGVFRPQKQQDLISQISEPSLLGLHQTSQNVSVGGFSSNRQNHQMSRFHNPFVNIGVPLNNQQYSDLTYKNKISMMRIEHEIQKNKRGHCEKQSHYSLPKEEFQLEEHHDQEQQLAFINAAPSYRSILQPSMQIHSNVTIAQKGAVPPMIAVSQKNSSTLNSNFNAPVRLTFQKKEKSIRSDSGSTILGNKQEIKPIINISKLNRDIQETLEVHQQNSSSKKVKKRTMLVEDQINIRDNSADNPPKKVMTPKSGLKITKKQEEKQEEKQQFNNGRNTRGLGRKTIEKQERLKQEMAKVKLRKKSESDTIFCKCFKSKCLKKYCECFALGFLCDDRCICNGCHNCSEFSDEIRDARRKIQSRDPKAFAKVKNNQIEGCTCKKSNCLKKYCECNQNGIACDPKKCKCVDCKNIK